MFLITRRNRTRNYCSRILLLGSNSSKRRWTAKTVNPLSIFGQHYHHNQDNFLLVEQVAKCANISPATVSARKELNTRAQTLNNIQSFPVTLSVSYKALSAPKKIIVIGLSGGVDSTVTAILLSQLSLQYSLIGVFMENWIDQNNPVCNNSEAWKSAQKVAKRLGIKIYKWKFERDYWLNVWEPFLDDITKGQMGNPDLGCNSVIKFGFFWEAAKTRLSADRMAFGHYAAVRNAKLYRARDSLKDQSYFLSMVPASVFQYTIFPLSIYNKPQVKSIAASFGFKTQAKRKESMGICFLPPQTSLSTVLSSHVIPMPGIFVSKTGEYLGECNNLHALVIGQRAKLPSFSCRMYVALKNSDLRTITLVPRDDPALYCDSMSLSKFKWMDPRQAGSRYNIWIKYRSRGDPSHGDLYVLDDSTVVVEFKARAEKVANGQAVVIYAADGEVLGCGMLQYRSG